jgi:purine-binding chemotaxis protein CheW
MPAYIRGVINLRGKIIPVIDLRIRLALDQANISERTCIMVVQAAFNSGMKTNFGLIVDSVEEVLNIPADQIEDPPEFACQVSNEYIIGMAKAKDLVITLLDVDKVLSENGSF